MPLDLGRPVAPPLTTRRPRATLPPLPLSPRRRCTRPPFSVPLFRLPKANPETGLIPPWSRRPVRKFFPKIIPDKFRNIPTAPRGMGPRAPKILNGFWVEGLAEAGRLTEYPSGSVICLLWRHSALTQGLVQDWGRCRWRCPYRASSPRRKGTPVRVDFLTPAASGVIPGCYRKGNLAFVAGAVLLGEAQRAPGRFP